MTPVQNEFNPSWALVSAFTAAINNSHLHTLSLTSNPQLSDTFVFRFLPNLAAPRLRSLHLSAMGLTPVSTPYIVKFLSVDGPSPPPGPKLPLLPTAPRKPTTRLDDLRLNGNAFTLPCVQSVFGALQKKNFCMQHLEMYGNSFDPFAGPPTPAEEALEGESPLSWQDYKTQMSLLFIRNRVLTTRAASSALHLLGPARALLLSPSAAAPSNPFAPWRTLPIELQLHILSLVHTGLSPQQRIRIWEYASERATLPPVMRSLPSLWGASTTLRPREERRGDWLEQVGCDRFEWYDGWDKDLELIAP